VKMLLKEGKKKVLTLSYDDAVIQDKRLVEILDKNGLKCTFNVNTGLYRGENGNEIGRRMTREDAIRLFANTSHEVAVHSYSHPRLENISMPEMVNEIVRDREEIERDFGVITRGMAYPFGTYDENVKQVLSACGIVYSRTVKSTKSFNFPSNWLEWHPTCHHKLENLFELLNKFLEPAPSWRDSQLFYLWGHSYEFDDDNNWDVIEKFAEEAGGHDYVWYATNIEIYDYVTAYRRLEISFDGKMIHNPSAVDVWVEVQGNEICIKADETVRI